MFHEGDWVLSFNQFSLGVSFEGSFFLEVFLSIIWVNSISVVNSRVVFNNGNNLSTITMEEL
jgi:hypothetical protein